MDHYIPLIRFGCILVSVVALCVALALVKRR